MVSVVVFMARIINVQKTLDKHFIGGNMQVRTTERAC